MKRSMFVFALFLLSACSTGDMAPREVAAGNPCVGPEPLLGRTEQSVTARLGPPQSRQTKRLPNRHDSRITDEIVTLRWDGAEVRLHTVPEHGASFLAQLDVFSPRFDLIPGLGVGMSRAAAAERLGVPDSGGAELRKECPQEVPPTITVRFENDRVARITWLNEPD